MDGRVTELSLRETLEKAHELRGLQGDSPLETAAMYRLLLAVLHSALRGPANEEKWAKLWDANQWDMKQLDEYLGKWHSGFDLFDKERPFYQVKNNKDGRQKIPNDVLPDVSSGVNATLFSHSMDEKSIVLSSAKAARTLLVMQIFSIAGGWGMAPAESSDAPWGRGIIFLVEGDNLFGILMLNLLKYPDKEVMASGEHDAPVWEMKDPFKPKRNEPVGYLDYLTYQNKRVSLIPEGDEENPLVQKMVISKGLELDASVVLDPMKHYRIDKKDGYKVLRFFEEKALWRDSSTLFKVHNSTTTRPTRNFSWLANLSLEGKVDKHSAYKFMALGMATENGRAKIEFYRHENMPMPLSYLTDETLADKLKEALLYAEETKSVLWQATSTMANIFIAPASDLKGGRRPDPADVAKLLKHWSAESNYWAKLETAFMQFIQDLPNDSPSDSSVMERWKEILQQTARQAFSGAERLAGESTNALKAAVKGRGVLTYKLKELFAEIQTQKEATA
jgi:CRISPR system Cascade subunit CasA